MANEGRINWQDFRSRVYIREPGEEKAVQKNTERLEAKIPDREDRESL